MDTVDCAVGWPIVEERDLFLDTLRAESARLGIGFLLVDPGNVAAVLEEVAAGRQKVRFFLDMASDTNDPGDPFTRLAYRLKDSGALVTDDPDCVRFAADKSISHFELLKAGIPVPQTAILRSREPVRPLPPETRERLGIPFIMKPSRGYGQRGIALIRTPDDLPAIEAARAAVPHDDYLLQEFIETRDFNGTPGWFRVFYLFGEVFPCWWNPTTHVYRQVAARELDEYRLAAMGRMAADIARISRVDWFSCEIAWNRKNDRLVAIDYMNDQCLLSTQSDCPWGVPDDLVRTFATKIAGRAAALRDGRGDPRPAGHVIVRVREDCPAQQA